MEYLSAPINPSSPPKKKEIKKASSIVTKNENKNEDLISNSEPSFFKASAIKQNEKENTDISFENYYYDNQIYVDNLLKHRNILENNYLKKPVEHEKFQRMEIMRNSLYSPEELEEKKYCNSCEDIYIPKNNEKNYKNKKNKAIIKLLDGDSLFDNEEDSNNNNISDNNDQRKFDNNKKIIEINNNKDINDINNRLFKEEKDFEGDEQYFFSDGIFGKDRENSLIDDNNENKKFNGKYTKNKKKKKSKNEDHKNKEDDKSNEEDKNLDENKNKAEEDIKYGYKKKKQNKSKNNINSKKYDNNLNKNNARNRFIKSIDRNNSESDSEERKDGNGENKNEKLKTEYDQDVNNKIKSELKKIARGEDDPNSIGGIFNKNRNNTLVSNDSDFNNLLKSQNTNLLKLKSKKRISKNSNMPNKNNSSKEIHSNRRMINFEEEPVKEGDMAIPISENNSKNDNISDIVNEEKNSKYNKSDYEMFNKKILASSISAFIDTEDNKPVLVEGNFKLFYWKYIQKRELCLVSFKDKNENIPYFVRWSCFAFCLIFIFLLNCLFYFEKNVHKRYLNALQGYKNSIGYYFKNEYLNSFYVALISIIFKIMMVKLILFKSFKIKRETKKMMRQHAEKGLDESQLEELQNKRKKFLKIYKIKLIIYFTLIMILSILFSYICICYAGVFSNSISAFLLGFLFSFITSVIICALFCLIIVVIYRIGKKFKNRCLLSTYIVLSTMY